jgi:hypothetical protein
MTGFETHHAHREYEISNLVIHLDDGSLMHLNGLTVETIDNFPLNSDGVAIQITGKAKEMTIQPSPFEKEAKKDDQSR